MGTVPATALYGCLEAAMAAAWLAVFAAPCGAGRAKFREELKSNGGHAVLAGAAIWLSYVLVLIALAFVRNVSYVASFRLLSIPLGTAFGVAALKEPPHAPRIAGVGIICLGLFLVAAG